MTANRKLSDWNAGARVVAKPDSDEMRITFNYSKVTEI
jgi:hypothetical protein